MSFPENAAAVIMKEQDCNDIIQKTRLPLFALCANARHVKPPYIQILSCTKY